MKENPRISIVTPTYNSEQYLEACILSIRNQRYENLEHIIIDGGSTDGTLEMIRKYEHDYPLRWISEPVQSEMGIFLRQVFDFQCIHLQSSMMQSSMSIRSCLLKLQVAASCVIFSRYSSIFLRFSSLRSSTFLGATKQPLAAMV